LRKIDGKFAIVDDKIVNPAGDPIPDDEPLFLLRARDHLAIDTLLAYRALSIRDNCTDYHLDGISDALHRFQEFKREHPERMKQPGITRGK
jgi:hypothetical protein